jgi:hypothetical protein
MKAHFTLSLTIVCTIFPANASWTGYYYGTVSSDVNSGGSSNVSDTLRVTGSSNTPNQITMFDQLDSITYTGTVNGTSVSMTATLPAVQGYSAETLTGTGTLLSGIFAGTVTGSYTYNGTLGHDTFSYNMIKH